MAKYLHSKDVKVFFVPQYLLSQGTRFEQLSDAPLEHIYASSVEISNSVSLSNSYLTERRAPEEPIPNASPQGTIRLNYFLTGKDPFKKYYFTNEHETRWIDYDADKSFGAGYPNMAFKIGGNVIRSGYLTSYSFSAKPNQPIAVNASISFFHGIDEASVTMDGETDALPKEVDFLKHDDLTIDNNSALGVGSNSLVDCPISMTTDNILGIDYDFEASVKPSTKIGQIYPNEIKFGEKNISLTINTHDTGIKISHTGEHINLSLKTHNSNGDLFDVFYISGKLTDKNYSVEAGGKAVSKLNISQSTIGGQPRITLISPTGSDSTPYPGEYVHVWGGNLGSVTEIEMNGSNAEISGQVADDLIAYVRIPDDISSMGWTSDARVYVKAYGIGGPSNSKEFFVSNRPIS